MYCLRHTPPILKQGDSVDVLQTRNELAKMLGYSTWADLRRPTRLWDTTNMKSFLDEVDKASNAAGREFEMLMAFAREKQPGLMSIPADSGFYWYEQYSRSVLHFDSQSVRLTLVRRVQQESWIRRRKLFHVTFRLWRCRLSGNRR